MWANAARTAAEQCPPEELADYLARRGLLTETEVDRAVRAMTDGRGADPSVLIEPVVPADVA